MTARPAISAHRGGAGDGPGPRALTIEAYEAALTSGAEYAEFDIRRTADGALVVFHDARVGPGGPPVSALGHAELSERAGYAVPALGEVMSVIAGKLTGHLDLKETGYEREVVGLSVDLLGEDGFVATTLEDASVAAITRDFPRVRTALSLGRGGARLRLGELFPLRRVRGCGAGGVAVHHRLAQATVLGQAARHGLFTMVWTVNDDGHLARFLRDPRVDVLITDRPRRAAALRRPPTHDTEPDSGPEELTAPR